MRFQISAVTLIFVFLCTQGVLFSQSFTEYTLSQNEDLFGPEQRLNASPTDKKAVTGRAPEHKTLAQKNTAEGATGLPDENNIPKENNETETQEKSELSGASITSSNLSDGGVYEDPFLRAEILFTSQSEWTRFEINGVNIKPGKNQGIYRLNYVIEFQEGINTILIKGYTQSGDEVSREYIVFFPEKNADLFKPRSMFVEIEGGIFYDTNPLFVDDDSSTDRSKNSGVYRRLGGQAFYFNNSRSYMNYKFMDKTYFDKKKHGRADYFLHEFGISQIYPTGIIGLHNLLKLNLRSVNINAKMYSGEIGLLGAINHRFGEQTAARPYFYRLTLYGAEKSFFSGVRKRMNPWYAEFLIGAGNAQIDDYYALKFLVGKDSNEYQRSRFQYYFAGANYHTTLFDVFKFMFEALYGQMDYDTDTDFGTQNTDTKKQVSTSKQLLNLYLIYVTGNFEIQYIYQYDRAGMSTEDEILIGSYRYAKQVHGMNLKYRF